ncbi:unnamed protein product [Arctogadus glacialis]
MILLCSNQTCAMFFLRVKEIRMGQHRHLVVDVSHCTTLRSQNVVSAPASEVPAASLVSHVRNKRCSCATFLDHECVYFCHLDIIWVNTPERIVSYGLGNMPRRRRSAGVPPAKSHGGARCRCLKGNDSACNNFCQPEHQLRQNKTSLGKKIRRAEGERCSGAGCARTPRMKRYGRKKRNSSVTVGGTQKRREIPGVYFAK